LPKKTTKSFT